MDRFRESASDNRKKISAQSFIEQTSAMGMTSKSGRHGGTFAHSDIALNFCYWLSPEFQVYFLKEFQRLKEQEAKTLNIEWNIRRELAKAHYPMPLTVNYHPIKEGRQVKSIQFEFCSIESFSIIDPIWRKNSISSRYGR